ncbi:trypsin-like peptidase domain-containing protein [Streptomyces sp. AM 4-1-1]|uniref:trypsin-like peptidase domain-containing protein n=1 Tax=Streptomyces sp. AM 4-1-1 TaxID=3028710 RepID=UPI0023B9F237|nr:trypsin-like peptidase domain-containing protein [Streptomyces sp. AM 4-1-1]WEH36175.1 trypsin-like peptidase domain-containing protein [Streptomyces sp. AM 4-1-1]
MGSGSRSALITICDQNGRPRGTGFVADDRGTVVTSHEAVDGRTGLVLHGADGRTCPAGPDTVIALPELDLALLRTDGTDTLGVRPLPIAVRGRIEPGAYVRIAAHGWREARVLGPATATYTCGGRSRPVGEAMELALGTDGRDALRSGGAAVGGPVVDPETGAVLAVLGTRLSAGHPAAGLAMPLWGRDDEPVLAELVRRNAVVVPGYGRDLNLAGASRLTTAPDGPAVGRPVDTRPEPVERPGIAAELAAFTAAREDPGGPVVLGLVGEPGTGRTTELAALAARRARGTVPALTVRLRGADLRADDTSLADAVARTLRRAGRIVTAAGARGAMADTTPERVAGLAVAWGSPLLVLLDGPEEMPPALAHRPAGWTTATTGWLTANRARLVIACRPEHWGTAGTHWPPGALYRPARPAPALPPAVRIGDLTARQAERARERYALPPGAVAPVADRHPLTLRLLAGVREELPADVPGRPGTEDVFAAHLDLMCLRIAVRVTARSGPAPRGAEVRRTAARVAGRVHEAARRCLGPGQGELDRAAFEEIFPWHTGWAAAVLTEGLLVAAGTGYRFAHEELGDWVQGAHLDVDAALHALVHRWGADAPMPGERGGPPRARGDGRLCPRPERERRPEKERSERREPSEPMPGRAPGAGAGAGAGTGAAAVTPTAVPGRPGRGARGGPAQPPGTRVLPVPRHRVGPVIQALLLLERRHGTDALARRMAGLADALNRSAPPAPAPPALRVPTARASVRAAAASVAAPVSAAAPASDMAPAPDTAPASDMAPAPDTAPASDMAPAPDTAPASDMAPAPDTASASGTAPAPDTAPSHPVDPARADEARWWAARLLAGTLLRVPDARPYLEVLRALAGWVTRRPGRAGGPGERSAYAEFGPWFWPRPRLPEADRLDLLRRLVTADGPPGADCGERYLDAAARRLAAAPRTVQPLLCRWFTDERPLTFDAVDGGESMRPTVAAAAQALLYARRDLAVDDLVEALVVTAHPRAGELLAALAEDEPSAMCRAVDRWARDDARPERWTDAATHARAVAPYTADPADRVLLHRCAVALLSRPDEPDVRGPALTVLVQDPATRERHLPAALRALAAGDPGRSASVAALAEALTSHPEPVLAAFRQCLARPGDAAGEVLSALAGTDSPALALHAADLVREYLDHHPDDAGAAAAYIDRRLEHGPAARALLRPLVTGLLRDRPGPVRAALAPVLAAPGSPDSREARAELLEELLAAEQGARPDPDVLAALLRAAAGADRGPESRTLALVHRAGTLLVRTPEGASRFDRELAELAREFPEFAASVLGRLEDAPQEWAAVVGPGARRTLETLCSRTPMPMRAGGPGHGSLRPA